MEDEGPRAAIGNGQTRGMVVSGGQSGRGLRSDIIDTVSTEDLLIGMIGLGDL